MTQCCRMLCFYDLLVSGITSISDFRSLRRHLHPGIIGLLMTAIQEEALYDYLDNATEEFDLNDLASYIRKLDSGKLSRLAAEAEAFINVRNLAFQSGPKSWISRRAFFEPLSFVISPTRLELTNGILIPGHRCVPFANPGLLPQEHCFYWHDSPVPYTTTEGPPEEFYPYYNIYGEDKAPQYVAGDNDANEEAFNSDPYDDPPEVSITTFDMRNIYRELSFVPGDRFLVRTRDWKEGNFTLEKIDKNDWSASELGAWSKAAEEGFEESFNRLGPSYGTEEQIAYAYWYGPSRMRETPAYSLEDFLFEKTNRIEASDYGIEKRFWYAGREIPDLKELDPGSTPPDKTPVEEALYRLKIPVSEYVVQSYVRDSLYREKGDVDLILARLIPSSVNVDSQDIRILIEYINAVLEDFRDFASPFSDKATGPVRQRAGELHTAVIDLAARLTKGDIDLSWLPRHTFIILSQIQSHTAGVLEDMDINEPPPEDEMEAIENFLDSMVETYEEIKEMIEEALDSFRRNSFALIRPGDNQETVTEWLIQLSISGIDIWRRLIVNGRCSFLELHRIIQTVFGWRDTQSFRFRAEIGQESAGHSEITDTDMSIETLEDQHITELLYEYGTKWTVRIMILSKNENKGAKPIRCIAGAGAAPPEFIEGPLRFRKAVAALENGNEMERLGARQELGPEFNPGDFDIEACNRNLTRNFPFKG